MKLRTIERQTQLPTRVATLLSQEITAGRLKPGDRLPTEQALAANFGVSRNVVREAIARLRSDGIVQSRQGVGAFLTRTEPASTLRIDVESLNDAEEFRNVLELRAILEIRAAGLAAERRVPDAMRDLTNAMKRMRSCEQLDQNAVEADVDFHRAVARATGNPYLVKVISFVSEQTRQSIVATRKRLQTVPEVMDLTIAEHTAIHDAIVEGLSAAARKAMSRHINNAAIRLGIQMEVDHTS